MGLCNISFLSVCASSLFNIKINIYQYHSQSLFKQITNLLKILASFFLKIFVTLLKIYNNYLFVLILIHCQQIVENLQILQILKFSSRIFQILMLSKILAVYVQKLEQPFINIQIFMSQQVKKQKTIDLGSAQVWAKITPLSSGLGAYDLDKPVVIIGRLPACDIQINDKRLSSKHCQIEKRDDKILLTDLSTNGTYIKDSKIGKNVEVQIKNHAQIWLLPASKVKPTQTLGFKLELNLKDEQKQEQEQPMKRSKTRSQSKLSQKQVQKQKQEQKAKQAVNKQKMDSLAQSIKDQITCAFCLQIMHHPVSVQPCNHRYCGSCLSQLVKSKKGDCIKCRKQITTAAKDAAFNSIIEDYLNNHPEEKRDPKEIQQMNKKNIFTFDPTDVIQMISGKPAKKKAPERATSAPRGRGRRAVRAGSDLSASDQDQARCRECMAARNGFQCPASQKHVGCLTCGKLIADRSDKSLHQYCVLCTQHFCNLYYPPCARSGVKLQLVESRKNQSKIDPELLRANKQEFQIIRNYLLSKKLTSKDVFDFVLKKIEKGQFSYIVDRKIMKIAPLASREVKMETDDAICDLCWKELWFQMVFFYRNQISAELPSSARDRPICYWGINCRTMDHNDDHARKYNHMTYQTRF